MAKKLDRSKNFQEVMGDDPNIKYRYIQNGQYFDDTEANIDPKATDEKERAPETEGEMRKRIRAELEAEMAAERGGESPAQAGDALAAIAAEGAAAVSGKVKPASKKK